jgi:hypothetical protein
MVRRCVSFTCLVVLTVATVCSAFAAEYKVGDRAEEDIVAPAALTVVDVPATQALKEREIRRVNVVYRFYPEAIDEAEAAFRAAFVKTREAFMDTLDKAFGQRVLTTELMASNLFEQTVTAFQKDNILLPVHAQLAAIWASGESDQELEAVLVGRLRETMKEYIRAETSPEDIWVGATLRLVTLNGSAAATERDVEEHGIDMAKTRFISLPRARTELQDKFPSDQRATGRYLASFVKPNCLMEADLTRQMRAKRAAGVNAVDHYQAGQVIVRRGQVINEKIKAALDELKKASAPADPANSSEAGVSNAPVQSVIPVPPSSQPATESQMRWLIGAVTAGFLLLTAMIWRISRRRPAATLLPVPISSGAIVGTGENEWRERALLAEQQAQRARELARAGLLSQFARWLSDRMTQKLIAQRTELVDAHQKAAMEMAELEARLEKVQAPLQERLLIYEKRIADLEKELAMKGEENRELIKAKLQVVRQQLEIEREKNRLEYN